MTFHELFPTARRFRDVEQQPTFKKSAKKIGCEFCPLNQVVGVNKVFGKVRGKEIMVWGMAPGPQENKERKEFIGPSGDFLWDELGKVGVERKDCDIQNVVRCFPCDRDEDSYPPLRMRNPTKEEIHCCSKYTKEAIEETKAKLHLVFGEVAQKALLGKEYSKNAGTFWSDNLKAHVACLYHPSYFLRMGYRVGSTQPANSILKQFRVSLQSAVGLLKGGGDRYGYLREQKYYGVRTIAAAKVAEDNLRWCSEQGWRIAVDMEDGILEEGRRAVLVCGFCGQKGESYVFCLDMENVEITDEARAYNWKVVRRLLSDKSIKKILHHGSYDVVGMLELGNIEFEGYDYDTEWAEYFADPDAKAYGLQSIVDKRYPEFAGYKTIVAPDAITPEFMATLDKKLTLTQRYEAARKRNGLNLARLPWKTMVLYNGGDSDVTKRVELSTKKKVNPELMKVYIDSGFIMAKMEKNGPIFDYKQHERLQKLYPIRVKKWKKKLIELAGKKDFNPGSPPQVSWMLFDLLGLEMPNGEKRSTRAEVLELLEGQHEAVTWILNFRKDAKILSTYLDGFKRSADMHEGKLTTKWWLTGTRTGRLSSGAGKEKAAKELGLVNLQNIVSNHQLQNMVISTEEWREIYRCWKLNGDFTEKTWEQFEDVDVLVGFDQGQFEMRVVAQRSGDEELIGVFERDEDIHGYVGHNLMGLPLEKILVEGPERVAVKGMHFGIVYGLKAAGLWAYLVAEYKKRKIKPLPTLEWVQNLLEKYFERFWKVEKMIKGDHKQAEQFGYVETMFGFRRPINVQEQQELGEQWKGSFWMNQASNTPIQGTAHQLLLLALVNLIRQKEKYKLLQRAQMEVHDAMYFLVKLKHLWKAVILGTEMLEKDALKVVREDFGIDWKVPLKVDPKAGFRFGVQVYKLGGKGPKTTAEFLNEWCRQNQKVEKEFREELEKVS